MDEQIKKSVFATLNAVNCNQHTEKKNGLTYLSWVWAWQEVKTKYPEAFYTIYENTNGLFYHTDGKTCWVKTGVTIEGIEHIEYLPVMDYRNNSIPADKVTSTDVNKAIQRSLTKACARHGLGLYIYAGEDLPTEEAAQPVAPQAAPRAAQSGRYPTKEEEVIRVKDYLAGNAAAMQYYLQQYKVRTIDELTEKDMRDVFAHLVEHNKISL